VDFRFINASVMQLKDDRDLVFVRTEPFRGHVAVAFREIVDKKWTTRFVDQMRANLKLPEGMALTSRDPAKGGADFRDHEPDLAGSH
jgi:hypothetical protein